MKIQFGLWAILALWMGGAKAEAADGVRLRGQIVELGTAQVRLEYNGASSYLGDSRDIILLPDAKGNIDTTLAIKEPGYYRISRNTLYLSPGDDLTVFLTSDQSEARFSGQGEQANQYLKGRLFPHAGSYLEGGGGLRNDFATTKAYIDSAAQARRQELHALQGVSQVFKDLEEARILADVINSLKYYPTYSNLYAAQWKRPGLQVPDMKAYYANLAEEIRPSLQALCKDELLDVEVVRSLLVDMNKNGAYYAGWNEGVVFTLRLQELANAAYMLGKMRQATTTETLSEAHALLAQMTQTDLSAELRAKVQQAERLLKSTAIDLELTTLGGEKKRLSDFKGKVLYVDFWATWCGPCLQEAPHFEALAKEFIGKDIVFLPISTDTNRSTWERFLKGGKKKLAQYNTVDPALREAWGVTHIPRFVVIGADFNIVDANAPRPSDPKAKALLQSLID